MAWRELVAIDRAPASCVSSNLEPVSAKLHTGGFTRVRAAEAVQLRTADVVPLARIGDPSILRDRTGRSKMRLSCISLMFPLACGTVLSALAADRAFPSYA